MKLTAMETNALCESKVAGGEPRFVNGNYRQFGSQEPDTLSIDKVRGLRCLAYAKDGILYRCVQGSQFVKVG